MNLVLITALVAVAGAAKLDRTYLPPASAKTAGGTGESLKTPFAGNSFNNGLGGIPKGSYTNDFQGVVVDAAAAGTRASEPGDTGLGAPRISYGSIDSKVGAAAFKVNNAGFRQPIGFQAGLEDGQAAGTAPQSFLQGSPQRTQGSHQESQGFSNAERPKAALDRSANTVRFESDVGPESFSYVYETDNGISAEESGVAIDGVQAQGAFSYTGDDGQVYSVSYTADEGGYQPKGDHLPTPPPIPEEILRSLEQNARDEAAGLVDDGSYDAQKYNAGSDYAAADNSNGKYNHQSSKFGNGAETDATASGTFISQNNQPFARPGQTGQNALKGSGNGASNSFGTSTNGFGQSGHGANDFTGHGTSAGSDSNQFSGQFNHGSSNGQSGHFGTSAPQKQFGSNTNRFSDQSGQGKFGASSSGLGQSGHGASTELSGQSSQDSNSLTGPSGFGQSGHAASSFAQSNNGFGLSSSGANKFTQGGQTTQESRFGSQNEYLPPKNSFNQNRPQSSRPQGSTGSQVSQFDQEPNTNNQNVNFQPLQHNGQNQNKLQGSVSGNSFGRPGSDSVSGQFNNGVSKIQPSQHASKPSSNVPSNLAQDGSSQISGNGFGSKNEYLPPINNFGQRKPNPGRPQGPTSLPATTQFNQQYNSNTETSEHFQSPQNQGHPQDSSSNTLSSVSGTQPTFGSQSSQQFNSFQRPQSSTNNGKPSQQDNIHFPSRGQFTSASTSSSFPSQQSTTQPDTELTTPLETSGTQQNIAGSSSSPTIPSFTTNFQPNRGRPTQPQLGNRFNNGASDSPTPTSPTAFPSFGTQSTSGPQRPSQSFGNGQTHSSAFPTHVPQGQFNQNSQFGNRQPSSSFSQSNDAQYSPSTQRPTYYQQSQNSDDSYNYNQPSKPFGVPQGSKFPSAPSNQFNRVTQGSSFSSSQTSQFPSAQQGSHTGFPSQSGQFPGSTKYPKPPTLAAVAPTSSSQDQGNTFNGITQASISPFPSESPTQSTQFNKQSQFGSRPNYQQSSNQFGQSQSTKPSFGSSQSSFGQQTTAVPSFPQRSGSKRPSFQGQTQTFGQQMLNQNGPEEETSESTPSQQYNGEIYEYNKPAQTLPAPDHDKEDETAVSGAGQFGQKQQNQFGRQPAKPQFGQTQDSDNSQSSTTSQFTQAHGSRPQSQFGQQNTQIQNKFGSQSKDQFGAQPSRPFSSANQFNQGSESQGNQQNQGNPQFGTQNSGGPFSSCCQSKLEEGKPTQGSPFGRPNQGFVDQTQNRFGAQSTSFASNQGFESESSASSFAGKGEVFGGPRKPPSFDEETGYHY